MAERICSVDGCGRKHNGKGHCQLHNRRKRTGVPQDMPIRRRIPGRICNAKECDRAYFGKGLCKAHYERLRTGTTLHGRIRSKAKAGDGHRDKHGYITFHHSKGKILEHHLVMEQEIGRPLFDHENVHHLNGQRSDNRLENLELWSTSQPPGQRVADKLAWCEWFQGQYVDTQLRLIAD